MNYRSSRRGIHPSMLDVAFTLVIMFLLLSTLANTTQQEAKEAALPPIDLTEVQQNDGGVGSTRIKSLTITVAPGPKYFLDGREIRFSNLGQEIRRRNPPEVELRADNSVPYGEVAKVLKTCTEIGIHNVALTFKSGS